MEFNSDRDELMPMLEVLRLACVVLFTTSIPLLVLARFKYSKFPAWLLITLATAVGWILPYTYMSLRAPMIRQIDRQERMAEEEYMRHPPPPIHNPDGSVTIENPIGIGDLVPEVYHPVASLLYGPTYLVCCWLAARLFFLRCAPALRRRLLFVSIGALLVEWAAFISELIRIKPPAIFSDEVFIYGWNSFFGPQLTLPLAMFTAWLLVAWLPTVAAVFKRRNRA
jgi:hypothetical protein